MEHFADRLLARCRQVGAPICVGVDPVYERLPPALRSGPVRSAGAAADAILRFSEGVFEAVADSAAAVKLQSACFERYLWPGVEAYHRLIEVAHGMGLIVIADAKRGDIGVSAAHYAAGCLGATSYADVGALAGPDALTVNAYLGRDSLEPLLDVAAAEGKGLFALVRTSNRGGDEVQASVLRAGGTVAHAVARMVADLSGREQGWVGRCGYSLLGAVVGATKPDEIAALRRLMPRQVFLVPGFGAQGGSADDVRSCFKPDGTGALVTASRSVIYAYDDGGDWQGAVRSAAARMRDEVRSVIG